MQRLTHGSRERLVERKTIAVVALQSQHEVDECISLQFEFAAVDGFARRTHNIVFLGRGDGFGMRGDVVEVVARNKLSCQFVTAPSEVEGTLAASLLRAEGALSAYPSSSSSVGDTWVEVDVKALGIIAIDNGWCRQAMETIDNHDGLLGLRVIIGREYLGGETDATLVGSHHLEVVEHIGHEFHLMLMSLDIDTIIEIGTTL